jgi:AraC-like DNA-binding protein
MAFATLTPPEPLSQLVESIWDWDAPAPAHRFERMLPVANAGLIINLAENETRVYDDAPGLACTKFSGAALDAPRHKSFVIDTAEQVRVMGVVFRCGAAAAFFRERMDAIANAHVELEDLVGPRACGLRERLLEASDSPSRLALLRAWIADIARHAAVTPVLIAHATGVLKRVPQVERIADACRDTGLSQRRFGSVFREHVGMSPKRYARLQRFRAVVDSIQRGARVEWSRVAADCGFYDQPHLVREFREFAGMTPSAYAAARGEYVNHVPLADA